MLLLGALFLLAGDLGLDVALGAFAAGMITGLVARGEQAEAFHVKLEGIGYGFLIPIFFITTGIEFDLDALLGSATARDRCRSSRSCSSWRAVLPCGCCIATSCPDASGPRSR